MTTTCAGSAQQVTTYTYGASSKTVTSTNALGETTVLTSDAIGRPLQTQISSAGISVRLKTYSYINGNTAVAETEGSSSDPIATTTLSDDAGRVLLKDHSDGTYVKYVYDPNGNLTSTTDEVGNTTAYTYNGLNQQVSQTLPDGNVTTFSYDAAGDLLTRGMLGGALDLSQTFDSEGRKLTERLFSSGATTRQFAYSYYPSSNAWAGRLQSVVAPRWTSTISYDSFLRPLTVTSTGPLPETNVTTTYGYDNRGLVTAINQSSVGNAAGPATQLTRTYDGYGMILNEAVTMGGTGVSSVTQTWDAAGRRVSLNEASSTLSSPLFSYQSRADGLMTQVSANGVAYGFTYGDNGLLTGRSNLYRSVTINSRDGEGRVLQETNAVAGSTAMQETMTWRPNSTLSSYSVLRYGTAAWNESRAYAYNSRGQLQSEGASPASGNTVTMAYTFDGGVPGLGVRTDAKEESGSLVAWEASASAVNSLSQVASDQLTSAPSVVPASGVSLGADHINLIVDGISQGQAAYAGSNDSVGNWSANLNLTPGSHTLVANAVHPSGLYTATTSSTFTVTGSPSGSVTNTFDGDGNVIGRSWASGINQTLTWDALGRLIKVAQEDSSGNGFNWSAVYDPLGRRIQTTLQPVVSGTANGSPTLTSSIFDPEVEFLEIGVAVNGAKAWKVYGPDMDGVFGALQGTGGLEATIVGSGQATQGVVSDQFGNVVAGSSGSVMTWFATRVGAYGPLPGSAAVPLTDITQVAASTTWRTGRIDPTGFYCLGARYYEPNSGRFLSADPLGQASSASLYDFAGGDPVNSFDPTGRCPVVVNVYGPQMSDRRTEFTQSGFPQSETQPLAFGVNSADPNPVNSGSNLLGNVIGSVLGGLWDATGGALVKAYNQGVDNIAGAIESAQSGDYTMAVLQGVAAAGNVATLALAAVGVGEAVGGGIEALASTAAESAEASAPGEIAAAGKAATTAAETGATAAEATIPETEVAVADVTPTGSTVAETATADSSAAANEADFTFRGTGASPDKVFNEGFTPRGDSTDLLAHALDNTKPPSNFVSTSLSPDVAAEFGNNVYVIRPTGGINVNEALGPLSPYPGELEVAIPGGVSPSNIRAVTLPSKGVSILNPNWLP